MSKFRSLLAAVSILLCAATLPVNGGLPKRHPAIAGYFLFQQDIPAKTVVLKGQGSTPANPSAGWYKLFVDNTGALKLLNSAGGVTAFGTGGGFELQTETSFTNNGDPALYLAGPVGSVTPFALFVNSNLDSMFSVSETGRVSSVDVEAVNGTFIAGNSNNLTFSMDTEGTTLRFYKYGAFEVISASTLNSGLPKSFLSWTDANDHSGITASTEYKAFWSNAAPTYTWGTGALTTNRFFHVAAPTMAFDGASTVTNAATFAISGAPIAGTNATITNPYALWVESGISRFDGRINAVSSDVSNPVIQGQNDTGTGVRGISLSSYGGYLTSRSSVALNASQTGTLSGNTTAAAALVKREHVLSGFTSTGPVLQVEQATGTGDLLSLVAGGTKVFKVDSRGVSASFPGGADGTDYVAGYQAAGLATPSGNYNVGVGYRTFYNGAGGGYNVVIGGASGGALGGTSLYNVIVGSGTANNETAISSSVVIGTTAFSQAAASYTGTGGLLIVGRNAGNDLTTQNNVAVFGSEIVPFNDWFLGEGYSSTTPSNVTFQPTIASGTNVAGASFYLKGGAGTGNATPGKLYLQYASAGSSGTAVQSYTTAVQIDSTATDITGLLVTDRLKGGTATPSISAGAGAGTGATVSVTGTDLAGEITITTGTATPDGGVVCTVTFSSAMSAAPFPQITPADVDAAGLGGLWFVTSNTTTLTINGLGVWPEGTQIKFNYFCPQ